MNVRTPDLCKVTPLIVAAVAVMLLGAGGCSKGGDTAKSAASSQPPSPSPSPSVDAAAELAASVKDLATTTFKVTFKNSGSDGPSTGTAVVDPTAKNASVAIEGDLQGSKIKIEMLLIGADRYSRFTGMPVPQLNSTAWMHLDTAKISAIKDLTVDKLTDPAGGQEFGKAIVTAQRSSPGQYTGTFDVTKALETATLTESEAAELGAAGKSVPFEATTDDKGRLTKLTFTVPAHGSSPAAAQEATFTEYGAPVTLTKPTGTQVKEAPASVYDMLGS